LSLWYESLSQCLLNCGQYYGVNKNASRLIQEKQAKCILAHLSMEVPRSWWESALQDGNVPENVDLLRDLLTELKKIPDIAPRVDYSLLIALAFYDKKENTQPIFDNDIQYSIEEYLTLAKQTLTKRNDLKKMGKIIAKHFEQQNNTANTL
jgi:hypothetical protein